MRQAKEMKARREAGQPDTDEQREARRNAADADRKALVELQKNPVFAELMREIGDLARLAAEAHEDETRTPGQRAEWLQAMKQLRGLTKWVERKARRTAEILGRPE